MGRTRDGGTATDRQEGPPMQTTAVGPRPARLRLIPDEPGLSGLYAQSAAPGAVQSLPARVIRHDVLSGICLALVILVLLWLVILLAGLGTEIPAVPTPAALPSPVLP